MPQLQDYGQSGSQTINLDGLAGAGLITVQYAFWVETADITASPVSISCFSEAPNNIPKQQDDDGGFYPGDTTTDPVASGTFTFFHSGASDPYIDLVQVSAGTSTYAYVIDWQTH